MPEMHYRLRWPDGDEQTCYSPSLVIQDFFQPGTAYPLPDFLQRIRSATHIASERVRAKYGFACSRANAQLAQIEAVAERHAAQPQAAVEVLAFSTDAAPGT
jgi:uncharacterized repeat protein (TIGR04042 family)